MAIAALWGFLYLLSCIVSTTLRLFNLLFLQLGNTIIDLKHTDLMIRLTEKIYVFNDIKQYVAVKLNFHRL